MICFSACLAPFLVSNSFLRLQFVLELMIPPHYRLGRTVAVRPCWGSPGFDPRSGHTFLFLPIGFGLRFGSFTAVGVLSSRLRFIGTSYVKPQSALVPLPGTFARPKDPPEPRFCLTPRTTHTRDNPEVDRHDVPRLIRYAEIVTRRTPVLVLGTDAQTPVTISG
jgi:hypothetical protein